MEVQLYVYDLSQGLARQMSMQFLGTQIDAVYHTSLVFGGVEYFFGRGIHTARPGSTHHGRPMEVISLGQTSLPQDIIQDYLASLKDIYTPESYSLFYHNCNNFTNDLAMFLVGQGIPGHITTLPKTVLDTPFGQMLQTQLEGAMRPITQAPIAENLPVRNGTAQHRTATPASLAQGTQSNGNIVGMVQNISSLQQFEEALHKANSSCAIAFFTSATCGPCKALDPLFDDLAAQNGSRATFLKVDVSITRDVGMQYSISTTPTFVAFLKGQQYDRWSGADTSQLRGNVRALLLEAFPPHPHQSLKLPYLRRLGATQAIIYGKVPPLDKLRAKMGEQGKDKAVDAAVSFISSRGNSENSKSTAIPNLPSISSFLIGCLQSLPTENLFAAYDLFRLLLCDPRISGYFLAENSLKTILAFLNHISKLQQANSTGIPYSLHLCAIHLACNLFSSSLVRDGMRSSHSEELTSSFMNLITSAILNVERQALSVSASSLAYNMSKLENIGRLKAIEREEIVSSILPEDAQVELAASVIEAISNTSKPSLDAKAAQQTADAIAALRYQSLVLANLLYLAPPDSALVDLCDTLNLKRVLADLVGSIDSAGSEKVTAAARVADKESESKQTHSLIREVMQLLKRSE